MSTFCQLRPASLAVLLLGYAVFLHGRAASAQVDGTQPHVVRLAMLRAVPEKWNLDANLQVFVEAADKAAQRQADILITPECWLDGYASPAKDSTPQRIHSIAQELEGSPYLSRVAAKAKEHGIFVCFGFTSLEDGLAYNAAGLWDSNGKLVGVYHKTHLQRHDLQYAFGRDLPVWPTPWGPVGMMICADRRWPETTRVLRLKGARLILNPTYGFCSELNEVMMRTRAYENQCYIAFTHPRQSLVTGPGGRIVGKADAADDVEQGPHLLLCEVDLSRAKNDNHLRDRRPELYHVLSEDKP